MPDEVKALEVVRELKRRIDIRPVEGVLGVYSVEVPYASTIQISDEQVVQEAHPWAVFAYLTALAHHGLTDLIPTEVFVKHYTDSTGGRFPIGTTPEDWIDVSPPPPKLPQRVGAVPVNWSRVKGEWDFGHTVSYSQGLPIYVTDVERTLLDAVRSPEKAGGVLVALGAWRAAVSSVDVERLVRYADKFDSPIVRQRVGYLMETLSLSHPRLAEWKQGLQRGGSVKLVAAAPYSPVYSEQWNLSLNVPGTVISELKKGADDDAVVSHLPQ